MKTVVVSSGANNLVACAGENIVALCDVDAGGYAAKTIAQYPKAKVYKDFRVMFDRQKDIDAVIVATPDHTHAVVALAAIRRGKHVYVQKPLTHSVYEARVLTEEARKYKVMTQMGNQAIRFPFRELQWDGAKMEVTNDSDANVYVRRQYRSGWTL